MAQYLSSGNLAENDGFNAVPAPAVAQAEQMSDLKVFWGPEICRLEYLLHLMDTGRIKDEYRQTALQ